MEFQNENSIITEIQQRDPVDNVNQLKDLINLLEKQKINIISHKKRQIEIPDLSNYVINNLPSETNYLNRLIEDAYHIEKNKSNDKLLFIYLDKFSKTLDQFKIYHLLQNKKFLKSLKI